MSYSDGGCKTGTVKWFNHEKGFGFITQDDGTGDVFVHFRSIEQAGGMGMRTLDEGERVEYYVEMGPKGLSACNVRRLGRV